MGKVAILFPGQGAQTVGMCRDFYDNFQSARDVFDKMGEGVKNLAFNGPQEELNLTGNAQPAIFAANLAVAYALDHAAIRPEGVAGFSLGEISGLVYSGMLSLDEGVRLVNFRAKVMEECTRKSVGGMAAVLNLDGDAVREICDGVSGTYPANFNSATQTVVSYADGAFDPLSDAVKTAGGRIMKLLVSGAFHSPLMNQAAAGLEQYLGGVGIIQPRLPLYSNYTAEIYDDNAKELIHKQVNNPVLWHKTIENMVRDGYDTFIEAGPGKVLGGLVKKIAPNAQVHSVFDVAGMEQARAIKN